MSTTIPGGLTKNVAGQFQNAKGELINEDGSPLEVEEAVEAPAAPVEVVEPVNEKALVEAPVGDGISVVREPASEGSPILSPFEDRPAGAATVTDAPTLDTVAGDEAEEAASEADFAEPLEG